MKSSEVLIYKITVAWRGYLRGTAPGELQELLEMIYILTMGLPVKKLITKIVETENDVVDALRTIISDISGDAVKQRGKFTIGLSGGSMVKFVCQSLPSIEVDWTKWSLFICDEMIMVPHADSTMKRYLDGLIGNTPLTKNQFVCVQTLLNVEDAAKEYEDALRVHFQDMHLPVFDLLLLGLGPDGHTASLFPNHPLLKEESVWIAPISDAPKPFPCSVTMTFPVINNARNCLFIAVGSGKADIVKRILSDKDDLPATHVMPKNGQLIWLLDQWAASKL